MILLDTNVVSELLRPRPDINFQNWFQSVAGLPLYISAITEGELWLGVFTLPEGKRRKLIESDIAAILSNEFAGHSLNFDSHCGLAYGKIFGKRQTLGRAISHEDCQIAAIAQVNKFKLATRNVADFEHCDIMLINPWEAIT